MIDHEGSLAELIEICKLTSGMIKTPADLARYQWIIDTVKPKVVVECGFAFGGSARWFAERVDRVISIDSNAEYLAAAADLPENVTTLCGTSIEVFDTVAQHVADLPGPVMVTLDSDHGRPTVLAEMRLYGQLVTPNSYMVVEDGIFHYYALNWYEGDPLQAIQQFLREGSDVHPDMRLENALPTTQNPLGWLVRGAAPAFPEMALSVVPAAAQAAPVPAASQGPSEPPARE